MSNVLQPCPDKPNCVSTEAVDSHRIEPIRFAGTGEEATRRLVAALSSYPRTRIVSNAGGVIRAEFTTRFLRFVDDAVFVVDEPAKVIRFRSASRVGHSDFGVNRRRIEDIRRLFDRAR